VGEERPIVFQTAHGPRWSQSPTGSLERVLPKDACLCAWHNSCVTESAPCARSHTSPFAKVTRSKRACDDHLSN